MSKAVVTKVIGVLAVSLGCGSAAFAGWAPQARLGVDTSHMNVTTTDSVTAAPEIDPAGALSGLTLLAGGLAVVRGRRSKK